MRDVVILTLSDGQGGCCADGACGVEPPPRVPMLHCQDALRAAGATVEVRSAGSDEEIDAVVGRLDVPEPRADGLPWPAADGPALIVAAATDGEVRAVVRRLVRRYAPPPSKRPADLPSGRTVPDLPPLAVLPLDDLPLATALGLPREPKEVAAAVLAGHSHRLDLLRTDAGSITLHGALLGGADEAGRAVPWRATVEVDDAVLSDGTDGLLACAVANAAGYTDLDGLPLAPGAVPDDGLVDVAVAVPRHERSLFGRRRTRIEVRRARGRAVAVGPVGDVPLLDDGVAGSLTRRRNWWVERGAWAVYR